MTTVPRAEARAELLGIRRRGAKRRAELPGRAAPSGSAGAAADAREELAPHYSARRGEYRVLYLIEDEQVTIIITAVTHRADAYRAR